MKKILLLALLSLLWIDASFAQRGVRKNNLSVELGGGSTLIGVLYERRLASNPKAGYAFGLSYGYSGSSTFIGKNADNTHGWTLPFNFNYLLGSWNHKLEFGAGVSLGYYHNKKKYINYTQEEMDGYIVLVPGETIRESKDLFGYYFFGNIGYRYVANSGLTFRLGVSPSFNFGDSHGVDKKGFYPYASVGYSF